jgi:hypothetical protein
MMKRDELADQNSCFNKAKDDEIIFVLKETDPSFTETVEFWANHHVGCGANERGDRKILEALNVADFVRRKRA